MNKLFALLSAFLVLIISAVHAQDITVDVKKPQTTYTSFSKSFNISFKNGDPEAKVRIIVKAPGLTIAPVLKEDADLTKVTISVRSPSKKKQVLKIGDGKEATISDTSFTIFVGDALSFRVMRSNDLVVDVAKLDKEYQAAYTRPLNISFKAPDATPKKVSIKYKGARVDTTTVLNAAADLKEYVLGFTVSGNALTTKDAKGNIVKIDEGPFTISIDKQSFRVASLPVPVSGNDQPGGDDQQLADKPRCGDVQIIDSKMLAGVSAGGACQLCDIRAVRVPIPGKEDRVYSTDYIVIYDPSLKKDAYTICKHEFQDITSANKDAVPGVKPTDKLYERYIKIAPKYFQPAVGSQIRFEVVNQPVNSPFKLTVDEQDVFNGGAAQFAALISSLVNTNIINPVTGSQPAAGDKGEGAEATGAEEETCLLSNLDAVSNQILQYITSFRVSSCAIETHQANLPIILSRINQQFDIIAMDLDQMNTALAGKIDKEVGDDNKAKALKKAEAIVNALKGLQSVTPIAYTTLRAKNRDFIEIKYIGADNVASKPENIRMSGGMKIDFSAGFVLTGLRDFTYTLKSATANYTPTGLSARDTTGNVIAREDDGSNQVGVGILTHFYPRASSHYNIGGTVGLMTSTNLNLRVMLGGSVLISSLFGSNNRVSFSGGVVWGKVKRLSTQYTDYFEHPRIVNNIPEFYTGATAPQTIDKNEHSWFFAITMNFGGN